MDTEREETALAVYCVMDGVDSCCVCFVPWNLIKQMDKYNIFLAQVTKVYSTADDSNCRRQKFKKKYGFAKAVLSSECATTKEAEKALTDATTSKENKQKEATIFEKLISRIKEDMACVIMLLYKIMSII